MVTFPPSARVAAWLSFALLTGCTTSVVAVPSTARTAYVVIASGPSSAMFHCIVEGEAPVCARVEEKGGAK